MGRRTASQGGEQPARRESCAARAGWKHQAVETTIVIFLDEVGCESLLIAGASTPHTVGEILSRPEGSLEQRLGVACAWRERCGEDSGRGVREALSADCGRTQRGLRRRQRWHRGCGWVKGRCRGACARASKRRAPTHARAWNRWRAAESGRGGRQRAAAGGGGCSAVWRNWPGGASQRGVGPRRRGARQNERCCAHEVALGEDASARGVAGSAAVGGWDQNGRVSQSCEQQRGKRLDIADERGEFRPRCEQAIRIDRVLPSACREAWHLLHARQTPPKQAQISWECRHPSSRAPQLSLQRPYRQSLRKSESEDQRLGLPVGSSQFNQTHKRR